MAKMRATVFHGPNEIRVEDVERPRPGPGEALMRVTLTTICGTDLHILRGEYPVRPGLVIGHEPVGILTTLCPAGKHRMSRLMGLARSGRFDPAQLLTHSFPLARINEAYDLFGARKDGVLKVAIRP